MKAQNHDKYMSKLYECKQPQIYLYKKKMAWREIIHTELT